MSTVPPERLAALALPVYAWTAETTPSERLAMLERDVGGLLRDLARSDARGADGARAHDEQLRALYLALVEVLDAFDRVFVHIDASLGGEEPPEWVGNFRTVARLLRNVLAERGVTELDDDGRRFDPRIHTVAAAVAGGRSDDGMVTQRLRRGYRWGEHILRKAEVVVVDRHAAREGTA
jgi:molecular chaperone GrpE